MGRARDLIPPPVVVLAEDDGLHFVRAKERRVHVRGTTKDMMAGFKRYIAVKYSARIALGMEAANIWREYLDKADSASLRTAPVR